MRAGFRFWGLGFGAWGLGFGGCGFEANSVWGLVEYFQCIPRAFNWIPLEGSKGCIGFRETLNPKPVGFMKLII